MHDIYISGTGHWKASHKVTNEEIVASFNEYVRLFNTEHEQEILAGSMEALGPSTVEFIEKASGIKTRYLIDKKNSLDTNVMKPILSQENPGKVSLEIIEVQSGSYLGEDDIVRFEDIYGRVVK